MILKDRRTCSLCWAKRNIDRMKLIESHYFCNHQVVAWYWKSHLCAFDPEVKQYFNLMRSIRKLIRMRKHISK